MIVPNDCPTIQQAINAASPGETIVVKDGIYIENVKVNKPVTIISENSSANCIVQAASNDHVFEITADNVTISGFTVESTGFSHAEIYLEANNCVITNNNIENNYYGIDLSYSNNNFDNINNVYTYKSINYFNSPKPITYQYNGKTSPIT